MTYQDMAEKLGDGEKIVLTIAAKYGDRRATVTIDRWTIDDDLIEYRDQLFTAEERLAQAVSESVA